MARAAKDKPKKQRKPRIDWGAIFRNRLFGEAWGILLLVGSALLLLIIVLAINVAVRSRSWTRNAA
jgi:hypothetical protein